jgi:hypothetical protein
MRWSRSGPGALVGLGLVGGVGLRITPAPLPRPRLTAAAPATVPLPADLPPPVERFYRELYGDEVPVIDSAIISGRGTMRVTGLTLPVRWRFIHQTGQHYRHHIEATFFGRPVLTVHETYLDGSARLELPFGVSDGANVDQAANLGLWAESIWMPSVWITDRRVHWGPVDDHTASLHVPFGATEETFIARFDPGTGLPRTLESLRFKGAAPANKTLWINLVHAWGRIDGWLLPTETALTWLDDGTPWARLTTEEVLYNADVREYVRQRGP